MQLKQCKRCGNEFEPIRKTHQYCSRSCSAKSRQYELECQKCGGKFISKTATAKWCESCLGSVCRICGKHFQCASPGEYTDICSLSCRGESQKQRVLWKCEQCGKEEWFSPYYAATRRFCSRKCLLNFQSIAINNPNWCGGDRTITCEICGKQYTVKPSQASSAKYCSRECQHKAYADKYSGENNPFAGKTHSEETRQAISDANTGRFVGDKSPFFGKTPSPETRQKMSENHADVSGENNPMWGKTHTLEVKQRLSKKASKRHAEGVVKSGRGKKGWHVSSISGERNRYESTYELERFRQLDQIKCKWTKHHKHVISYWFDGMSRRYTPDIKVEYPDGKVVIEEIKPVYMLKDPRTQAKIAAGERWCAKRGFEYKVLTEYDLGLKKPPQQ